MIEFLRVAGIILAVTFSAAAINYSGVYFGIWEDTGLNGIVVYAATVSIVVGIMEITDWFRWNKVIAVKR